MKLFVIILYIIFIQFPLPAFSDASVSPILFFIRNSEPGHLAKKAHISDNREAPVTVRFASTPDINKLNELERHGLTFKRDNGVILHTQHIYCAIVALDSLEILARYDDIIRIESTFNPSRTSSLDVSNRLVQASNVRQLTYNSTNIDGSGIIFANVDTGIDLFHPAFFKPDGGTYEWIDVNESGQFENGIDAVDLNKNGLRDTGETLGFFDASFIDEYGIMHNTKDVYDADIDWLYNDQNENGVRDFGIAHGYTDSSPSFGELFFVISDDNGNNSLDLDERLTALGTSKVLATFDKNGKHYRGTDLLSSQEDTANHGTPSFGIVGGQSPGRKFIGMAPGVEFISINRLEINDIFEALIWARDIGAQLIMYEFGSWVGEFLDGSSNLEVFINDLYNDGIHQFTASGNLAGPARKKHAYFELKSGDNETLQFSVPASYNITEVYFSLIWRNRALYRPISGLNLSDTEPVTLYADGIPHTTGKYTVISATDYADKEISPPTGTARFDVVISSEDGIWGDMSFTFKNSRRIDLELDAYISDNKTMWMHGAQFQNHLTDDGTICSPGSAKKGITVGAYDPRGYRNTNGSLSDFSSWGKLLTAAVPSTLQRRDSLFFLPHHHIIPENRAVMSILEGQAQLYRMLPAALLLLCRHHQV